MRRTGIVAMVAAVTLLVGAVGVALASPPTEANGTLQQTEILGEEISFAGPNVIIETSIAADVSGTMGGTVVETFKVVIHPNGKFTAKGTSSCLCTVDGVGSGVLEWVLTDTGEIIDGVPTFAGRWILQGGTDDLDGLRGVLQMEGEVDLATGLSVVTYSGGIHSHP